MNIQQEHLKVVKIYLVTDKEVEACKEVQEVISEENYELEIVEINSNIDQINGSNIILKAVKIKLI